ncbi:MAG: beta-lactamase [Verrucomicrobia bacterium]|jgi:CubicO group peptidase (beta-lactamase class C family)|nr:beta-lactamase [Verrucomicrobiota bacterium]
MSISNSWLKPAFVLGCLCLTTTLIGAELPVAKPESVGMSSEKLQAVDKIVEDLIAKKRLAGAHVSVTRKGKVVYNKTFGKMDIEADKAMRDDAIIRIYSMSKSITTAAALMLYDDGKLGLDDPISKYIPEFKDIKIWSESGLQPVKREPTVRDLMRHTAGMTYGGIGNPEADKAFKEAKLMDRGQTLQEFGARLGKLPLKYEPGTQWIYSMATDVLGRVVEVASGKSFDVFLQDRIFTPLDMKDTGFHVPAEKLDRLMTVYNSDNKGTLKPTDVPAKSNYRTKPTFLSGGGGLVSTTRDYLRFLQMVANGGELDGKRLLKKKTADLMTHNELPEIAMPIRFGNEQREGLGFGLGFNVRVTKSEKWDPASPVGEWGWGGMASTHYWASPKDDLVVVTMEQTLPYSFMLEWAVKKPIYDAIVK